MNNRIIISLCLINMIHAQDDIDLQRETGQSLRLKKILEAPIPDPAKPRSKEDIHKELIDAVPIITDDDRKYFRNVGGAQKRFEKKMAEGKEELAKFRELRKVASKNLASYQPGAIV